VIEFLRDFLWSKQTFASAVADLLALASLPGSVALLSALPPEYSWVAPVVAVMGGYASGAVSGKKTGRPE
jgi:hypothetical protein